MEPRDIQVPIQTSQKCYPLRSALKAIQAQSEVTELNCVLSRVRDRLESLTEMVGNPPLKRFSGWFVLLKEVKEPIGALDRFLFVRVINPDLATVDDEKLEWDVALAIPDPRTLQEFTGW
jgi:hypothetical protein